MSQNKKLIPAPVDINEEDKENIGKLITVCSENLAAMRNFLMASKEQVAKKSSAMTATDIISNCLILLEGAQGKQNTETSIAKAVKKALAASNIGTIQKANIEHSYSQAASKPTVEKLSLPKKYTEKFKILIKPARRNEEIKSSEDTKKKLMTKTPKELGIKVDKIVYMKDKCVLLESQSNSIFNLEDSKALEALNLINI